MRILIGADIVPVAANMDAFCQGDTETLVDAQLKAVLDGADYRIFNLEVPLTDRSSPIDKHGPALIAAKGTVKGIRALGADFVTLANNHIMDQGVQGLYDTLQALDQENISHAGAGASLEDAAKPYLIEIDGVKLGIYCCAEYEFSIATCKKPGANPFDSLWSLDHIQELKRSCDYVIVLYHGGKEHYRYPSPRLQQVCRRIVEKGADLVLCQHSHCIGCQEQWEEGTIVYGQGNFLFAKNTSELWQTGLLVQLDLTRDSRKVDYVPLRRKNSGVALAQNEDAQQIMEAFEKRSKEIRVPDFVEERFAGYAYDNLENYYGRSLGSRFSFLFRAVNKLLGHKLQNRCYSRQDMLAMINMLDCEAHRELYSTGLKYLFSRQGKRDNG